MHRHEGRLYTRSEQESGVGRSAGSEMSLQGERRRRRGCEGRTAAGSSETQCRITCAQEATAACSISKCSCNCAEEGAHDGIYAGVREECVFRGEA